VSNVSGVAAVPAVAVAVDSDSQPGIAYMLACLLVCVLAVVNECFCVPAVSKPLVDGGSVAVASSTPPLTEHAKALVMFLLKHPLQGQSIWIRDIAHALDISSDQVIAAVDCLGWNSERKKWLKGGKTAPRLEIADPMQLEALAAPFSDASSVPALSQTRAARVKAKSRLHLSTA